MYWKYEQLKAAFESDFEPTNEANPVLRIRLFEYVFANSDSCVIMRNFGIVYLKNMKINKFINLVSNRLSIAFLVVIMLILYSVFITVQYENSDHAIKYCDRLRLMNIISRIERIYSESGVLYSSIDLFEKSMYYPYNETYKKLTITYKKPLIDNNKYLMIVVSENERYLILSGLRTTDAEPEKLLVQQYNLLSAEQLTRIRMLRYVSGSKENLRVINTIRNDFIHDNRSAFRRRKRWINSFTIKPVPVSPLIVDLPQSTQDIQKYISWLSLLEGNPDLQDAWGHKLLFNLHDSKLVCQSRGEDGLASTADDIYATSKSILSSKGAPGQ